MGEGGWETCVGGERKVREKRECKKRGRQKTSKPNRRCRVFEERESEEEEGCVPVRAFRLSRVSYEDNQTTAFACNTSSKSPFLLIYTCRVLASYWRHGREGADSPMSAIVH